MDKNLFNENEDAMNKLLLEMVKNQKNSIKNLTKVFIISIICYTLLLISLIVGFVVYESQFETTETTTTTVTTTQEVDGENSEINNVLGNMYKDNSVHNDNGE